MYMQVCERVCAHTHTHTPPHSLVSPCFFVCLFFQEICYKWKQFAYSSVLDYIPLECRHHEGRTFACPVPSCILYILNSTLHIEVPLWIFLKSVSEWMLHLWFHCFPSFCRKTFLMLELSCSFQGWVWIYLSFLSSLEKKLYSILRKPVCVRVIIS